MDMFAYSKQNMYEAKRKVQLSWVKVCQSLLFLFREKFLVSFQEQRGG